MRQAEGQGPEEQAAASKQSGTEAGAVAGSCAAIAAYGFAFVPAMSAAMAVTDTLRILIGFHATFLAACRRCYALKGAEVPG
ncbi:hypothetical protein ABZW32_27205 [Streptomyces sp. NPDC004667]|uniref:hypothetical protein n=1 Tax=Streptomyces sp. NPDC004667 TaxID=3154285 RepID=UPI0033B4B8C0